MRLSLRTIRLGVLAVVAVAGLVAIAACGDGKEGPPGGNLAANQTLRVWLDGEPDYIDPSIADFATTVTIAKNLFATLLRFDPTTGEVFPYVAEEVPTVENGGISEDGLTYTLHLRDGAVWEDGQPITAEQFVYSFRRLMDPRLGSYYGTTFYNEVIVGGAELAGADPEADEATLEQLQAAVGVRAVAERTLEIKLTRPSTTFDLLLTLWSTAALRQDVIEGFGDIANSEWTEAGNLVASGPFRLAEWAHGTRVVLEKNPRFWLEEMTPTLNRIELIILEEENTAFSAYQTGDLDAVEVPLANLKSVSADPTLSKELRRVAQASTFGFEFNHRQPPFDNADARRAFCAGIDRETLINEISQGSGAPATAWYPPSLVPFHEPDRGKELAFDADAAQAALGASDQDFSDVKFSYANTGANPDRVEFLLGQWKANLGLDMKPEALDPAAFGNAYNEGNYDMAFVGWAQDYNHPENWMLIWKTGGGLNTGGYSSKNFDDTVDDAVAEDDAAQAEQLWKRAEEILLDEDAALCPLFFDEFAWLVKPYVRDYAITGADGTPGDFFFWKAAILEH